MKKIVILFFTLFLLSGIATAQEFICKDNSHPIYPFSKFMMLYDDEISSSYQQAMLLLEPTNIKYDVWYYNVKFDPLYPTTIGNKEMPKIICSCGSTEKVNQFWEHYGGILTCEYDSLTSLGFRGKCKANVVYDGVTTFHIYGGSPKENKPLFSWYAIEDVGTNNLCIGYSADCATFDGNKATCLKQDGCGWIGGEEYGRCQGQHLPCNTFDTYLACEKNIFCEWRGEK